MLNIESYLNDGANWQAQCVLSYIRSHNPFSGTIEIQVGRFENCREQGYVFTLVKNFQQIRHYAVYEHRNSDELIVLIQNGFSLNTPNVEFFESNNKYDYDKSFKCGEIVECGEYILNDMKNLINKY